MSLLENFIVDEANSTIQLDQENCRPVDFNIYVGYLLGRLSAYDLTGRSHMTIYRDSIIFNSPMGVTTVVPDFYSEHGEGFRLLTHHGINILFSKDNNCYIGAKVNVSEDGVFSSSSDYSDCNGRSGYIMAAGLKALINYLEKDETDKRTELFKEFKECGLVAN